MSTRNVVCCAGKHGSITSCKIFRDLHIFNVSKRNECGFENFFSKLISSTTCNIGHICLFCWSKFLSLYPSLSHLLLLLSLSDSDVFGRIASVCLSVLHVEHHPEFAPAISNVRYVGHAFCGFGYLGEVQKSIY